MTDDLAAALARAERAEAELAKYRQDGVTRPPDDDPTFYRQDLADAEFFHAHKAEILRAAARGKIIDDPARPDWRVPGSRTQAQREAARKAATR